MSSSSIFQAQMNEKYQLTVQQDKGLITSLRIGLNTGHWASVVLKEASVTVAAPAVLVGTHVNWLSNCLESRRALASKFQRNKMFLRVNIQYCGEPP